MKISKYILLSIVLYFYASVFSNADSLLIKGDGLIIGHNAGWNTDLKAPVDLAWDMETLRLYTRSLYLTETGDAVDLRIRRLPGKYPDGPAESNSSSAGEVPGGIHWDSLTPDGWRQSAGIEGVLGDQMGPSPTRTSHPGWLTFYTYSKQHDDRLRRMIIDDTGAVSIGGGGFGSEGLPAPSYGLHIFGGGLRVQKVESPEAPRLSIIGTGGNDKYTYQIVGLDSKGNQSYVSKPATIYGPEILSEDRFIRIVWDRSSGAESYWIIRNGKKIDINFQAEGNSKTFEDKGFAAINYEPISRNESGDAEIDGSLFLKQSIYTPGVCISEATKGVLNNYSSNGLQDSASLVFNSSDELILTGIKAPEAEGRWLIVLNIGNGSLLLKNGSPDSISANRILTGTGKDIELKKDQMVQLIYLIGCWRLLSGR